MSSPTVIEPGNTALLQVLDLHKRFQSRPTLFGAEGETLAAVDGVGFSLRRGEVLGLAGESGSGKSTLARLLCQLLPPDRGEILLDGVSMRDMDQAQRMAARRRIQMIFQDPSAALSPRRSIRQTLREPQDHFRLGNPAERERNAIDALASVGLDASAMGRLPHQFSSGQRQRISIARALLAQPDLLIADEAVSALDVSVQAQILDLLSRLRQERGIAMLFISHDLAVIRQLADRVGIMFRGKLVELGPAVNIFERAGHPYTRELLAAVTDPAPRDSAPIRAGQVSRITGPGAPRPEPGCPFEPRCPQRRAECRQQPPHERTISASLGHVVKCVLADTKDCDETHVS
jgi:peptide/nickel transport system ATP-binding protein